MPLIRRRDKSTDLTEKENDANLDEIEFAIAARAPSNHTHQFVSAQANNALSPGDDGGAYLPASALGGGGGAVTSVAGKVGAVSLGPGDVGAAAASHSHSDATTGAAGFMTAADKTKLNGVAAAATANAPDATLVARSNHTGTQAQSSVDGLVAALAAKAESSHAHGNATTGAPGFMSTADKTKLDGISDGASVNSPDAVLLSRANHTGTQAPSTVTGLVEALDGLQAGIDTKASASALADKADAATTATGLSQALRNIEAPTSQIGIPVTQGNDTNNVDIYPLEDLLALDNHLLLFRSIAGRVKSVQVTPSDLASLIEDQKTTIALTGAGARNVDVDAMTRDITVAPSGGNIGLGQVTGIRVGQRIPMTFIQGATPFEIEIASGSNVALFDPATLDTFPAAPSQIAEFELYGRRGISGLAVPTLKYIGGPPDIGALAASQWEVIGLHPEYFTLSNNEDGELVITVNTNVTTNHLIRYKPTSFLNGTVRAIILIEGWDATTDQHIVGAGMRLSGTNGVTSSINGIGNIICRNGAVGGDPFTTRARKITSGASTTIGTISPTITDGLLSTYEDLQLTVGPNSGTPANIDMAFSARREGQGSPDYTDAVENSAPGSILGTGVGLFCHSMQTAKTVRVKLFSATAA